MRGGLGDVRRRVTVLQLALLAADKRAAVLASGSTRDDSSSDIFLQFWMVEIVWSLLRKNTGSEVAQGLEVEVTL